MNGIARLVTTAATLVILFSAPGMAADKKPREIKIKGYVTNVTSPTQFEIEDYRITRDPRDRAIRTLLDRRGLVIVSRAWPARTVCAGANGIGVASLTCPSI